VPRGHARRDLADRRAKRQDQISSELALHDYETNAEADEIVKAIHALTTELHQKICAPPSTAA